MASAVTLSGVLQLVQFDKKWKYVFLRVSETDPDNPNYLATGKLQLLISLSNVIDGLMENDRHGNFVPTIIEDHLYLKMVLICSASNREDKWYTEGESTQLWKLKTL